MSAWVRTRTPSRRVSRSGSASALRSSSANAMLTLSAIVLVLLFGLTPKEEPRDGRFRQQVRESDGGPLPSLEASHGLVPRQGRGAACSARRARSAPVGDGAPSW